MVNRRAEVPGATGTSQRSGWTASGASVRGASHVRDGLPNQDAIASWTSNDASPRVAIVSIADGHGSPRHFRSALGARFAVEESVAVLREFASVMDVSDAATRAHLLAVDIPQRIVEGWTVRTREHLQAHPLTDAEFHGVAQSESDAAAADVAADHLLAYGATVLGAMVTERCVVLTQLGDGDVLAVEADGTTTRPLPTDERLSGNLTTSICRAGAESDFRSIALPRTSTLAALLLSTDGYANSFKSDADFMQVGRDFVAMIAKDGIAGVDRQLEAILLDASTIGSGDDITLGILQCVDGSAAALEMAAKLRAASSVPAAHHGSGSATTDPRLVEAEHHVKRMRIISTIALLVAIGVVGYTWRDHLPSWGSSTNAPPDIRAKGDDKGGSPKGTTKGGPKGDGAGGSGPTTPDFKGEPPALPGGLPANKSGSDGGIVAPAAAQIEEIKAKRVADGLRVTAQIDLSSISATSCRFESTLWNAKDQKIGSSSEPLALPGKARSAALAGVATIEKVKAETTIVFTKDAAQVKALKAKDARFSTAVSCDEHQVAESAKQSVDG
jgi:Protein phosphatase 2C